MSVRNPLVWRGILAVAACVAVTGFGPGVARAHDHGRWCFDAGDLGTGLECQFDTFEQCQARARGNSNICTPNPHYVPEPVPVRRQRREPRA